jgi:hypothetical protein
MLTRILANKNLHLIGFLLFYIILGYEYFNFIVPFFEDKGFTLEIVFDKTIIGFIIFIILTIKIFFMKQPSGFVYVLSIFAGMGLCIPAIIMYQFAGVTILSPILSVVFILILTNRYLSFPPIKSINLKW